LDTRHRKIDTLNIGHKTQKDRHGCYLWLSFCVLCPLLPVSIFLCLVSNVTRVYLSVSCVQCYPCLYFCVLCPMVPVSIFQCLVVTLDTIHKKIDTGNIGHKAQKDRHGQHWAPDTERCPMLPVSLFLCLVSNGTRFYLSVSCVQCYTCLSFCVLCPMLPVSIFMCLVPNVARVIDTGNIGYKTQKDRHE
jgi:hypothetical protein